MPAVQTNNPTQAASVAALLEKLITPGHSVLEMAGGMIDAATRGLSGVFDGLAERFTGMGTWDQAKLVQAAAAAELDMGRR